MHKIFLLHGMGNFEEGWAKPAEDALKEYYARYSFSKEVPFGENFEVVPITYNDIFDRYLAEWRIHADNLGPWGKLTVPIGNTAVKEMTKIATGAPGDNFTARYLGDVMLYMLTNIREPVKVQVLERITSTLEPGAADGWSIIAHSLGTRVITDSLQALFTDPALAPKALAFGRPKVLMTVANVSRLLEKLAEKLLKKAQGDVYMNAVFPSLDPRSGACRRFVNAAHELDPFLAPWPFNPPHGFGNTGGPPSDTSLYRHVQIQARDLTGSNPHALLHYLKHPKVHQAFFQSLLGFSDVSIFSEHEKASEADAYSKETLGSALQKRREELLNLQWDHERLLKDLLALWQKFLEGNDDEN